MTEYEIIDLGKLSYFLGMEFVSREKGIFLYQKKYITDVLKRFKMLECKPVSTPVNTIVKLQKNATNEGVDSTLFRQLIGSLRYVFHSRPDIVYSVGVASRYMKVPKRTHMVVAKRILRYLKDTIDWGILFPSTEGPATTELVGYTNADWSGETKDRKNTSGYIFMMGKAPIAWCLKKQDVVALSSYEAEYIAATFGASQAQWLQMLLHELKVKCESAMRLKVDNKSAIDLAKHPIAHGRSKHIEIKYHSLRDQVAKGKLAVEHCSTEDQLADMLTKGLKTSKFEAMRSKIGMLSLASLN